MTKVEEIRAEIKRLDAITDDDSISDEEFQDIESQISELYTRLNTAIEEEEHNRLKRKAPRVTPWEEKFLASFGNKSISRIITKNQLQIFLRIARVEGSTCEFAHGNFRYYAIDTRNNFAHLIIERI